MANNERKDINQIFSEIDKASVKELINIYRRHSEKYKVGSKEIDNIIHIAVDRKDVDRLRSLLKDFVFFAPCIRELNNLTTEYFTALIDKLSQFSDIVMTSFNIDERIAIELLAEINFSIHVFDKENDIIVGGIQKLSQMNLEQGEYTKPALTWMAVGEKLDSVLVILKDIVEDGILCQDLFEQLHEIIMKILNERSEVHEILNEFEKSIMRFKQREFYKMQ
jgi:hypothetical protein